MSAFNASMPMVAAPLTPVRGYAKFNNLYLGEIIQGPLLTLLPDKNLKVREILVAFKVKTIKQYGILSFDFQAPSEAETEFKRLELLPFSKNKKPYIFHNAVLNMQRCSAFANRQNQYTLEYEFLVRTENQ